MQTMKKAIMTIMILSLIIAGHAFAAEKRYKLPSGDVDLVEFTRKVSRITGFSFLHGPDFKGTVHLVVNHEVTPQEAYEILISVLADQGYTTVEKGRIIKIVPIAEGMDPNLVFMKNEPIGPSDQRVTVFIDLSHIESAEAAAGLQPLVGPQGKLLAAPAGNRLIVVDDAANVERIRKAVAAMDVKGAKIVVEVVHLKRAGAVQVAEILQKLFPKVGRTQGTSFGKGFVALADVRTNSVIIQAKSDEVHVARKICNRIDDPKHPGALTVDYLKQASATEITELFQKLQ
jgi:general secretion pathway protein D